MMLGLLLLIWIPFGVAILIGYATESKEIGIVAGVLVLGGLLVGC